MIAGARSSFPGFDAAESDLLSAELEDADISNSGNGKCANDPNSKTSRKLRVGRHNNAFRLDDSRRSLSRHPILN